VEWLLRARGSATLAVLLLVATNLVPLAGVLLFGWDLFTILILYWIENGIVGVFNLVKISLAAGPPESAVPRFKLGGAVQKAALLPFFLVHYGMFWAVHGVFVFVLTLMGGSLLGTDAGVSLAGVLIGAVGLLLSHTASLRLNYIGRGEYRHISPGAQFAQPYPRMIALHVTILLGGFFIMGLGQPLLLIALLVLLKTGLDLALHLREHTRLQRAAVSA